MSAEEWADPWPRMLADMDAGKLNGPSEWVYVVDPVTAFGGGSTEYLSDDQEVAAYEANPDLWVSQYFGFAAVDDYYEWVREMGVPLCVAKTAKGKPCKIPVGNQCDAAEFRALHRKALCKIHS